MSNHLEHNYHLGIINVNFLIENNYLIYFIKIFKKISDYLLIYDIIDYKIYLNNRQ